MLKNILNKIRCLENRAQWWCLPHHPDFEVQVLASNLSTSAIDVTSDGTTDKEDLLGPSQPHSRI
tara:strand:+ start:236 stop:430 length:195 start_codon:yes stop_codon:yes gene_type:complete